MGSMASPTYAYERGGHCLPGGSAVGPKGGVPDTFITFRNPPARDVVCAKWGLGYWSGKKKVKAPTCVATAKMNRENIKICGFKVFVRPWNQGCMLQNGFRFIVLFSKAPPVSCDISRKLKSSHDP